MKIYYHVRARDCRIRRMTKWIQNFSLRCWKFKNKRKVGTVMVKYRVKAFWRERLLPLSESQTLFHVYIVVHSGTVHCIWYSLYVSLKVLPSTDYLGDPSLHVMMLWLFEMSSFLRVKWIYTQWFIIKYRQSYFFCMMLELSFWYDLLLSFV